MAENQTGLKSGFHRDIPNSRLEVWFNGVEQMRMTSTSLTLLPAGTAELVVNASAAYPATTDGLALGTTNYMWSDLMLASGAVINFNNGNLTLTHSASHMKLATSLAAPALEDGYGMFEFESTISGTVAGYAVASSTWINLASGTVCGSNILAVQNNGIYAPSGLTVTSSTWILGARMQCIVADGAQPAKLCLFDMNIYDNALTSMFRGNALSELGGATGASTGNDWKVPFYYDVTANQLWYINMYHA